METIHQEFQVSFRYPVHFTTDLFDPGNPLLHQVIGDGGGGLPKRLLAVVDRGRVRRFPDLRQALPLLDHGPGGQWRIHYHLPLFVESFGALASTREETRTVLQLLHAQRFCPHLEIETYTWE